METLAVEVSKALGVTLEKAIELMPIIRQQFINYEIITSLQIVLVILTFCSGIATTIFNDTEYDKLFVISFILTFAFAILFLAGFVVAPLIAPDYMILKKLIL